MCLSFICETNSVSKLPTSKWYTTWDRRVNKFSNQQFVRLHFAFTQLYLWHKNPSLLSPFHRFIHFHSHHFTATISLFTSLVCCYSVLRCYNELRIFLVITFALRLRSYLVFIADILCGLICCFTCGKFKCKSNRRKKYQISNIRSERSSTTKYQ